MNAQPGRDVGDPRVSRNESESLHSFFKVMLEKLAKNSFKGGWAGENSLTLYERLQDERKELRDAVLAYEDSRQSLMAHHLTSENRIALEAEVLRLGKAVAREAADVANFAMMIADVCGGLEK